MPPLPSASSSSDEEEEKRAREYGTEKDIPPVLRGDWEWEWSPSMGLDEEVEERRRAVRESMEEDVAACYSCMSTEELVRDIWDYQEGVKAILSTAASLLEAQREVRMWIRGTQEEMMELHRRWKVERARCDALLSCPSDLTPSPGPSGPPPSPPSRSDGSTMTCSPEREDRSIMAVPSRGDQATDRPRTEERGANTVPPPGRENRGTMVDVPGSVPFPAELMDRLVALEGTVQSRMAALEEAVGELDRRVVSPPLNHNGQAKVGEKESPPPSGASIRESGGGARGKRMRRGAPEKRGKGRPPGTWVQVVSNGRSARKGGKAPPNRTKRRRSALVDRGLPWTRPWCFRCLRPGHLGSECRSSESRGALCYRCSAPGHRAARCSSSVVRCPLCADVSRPTGHSFGSPSCFLGGAILWSRRSPRPQEGEVPYGTRRPKRDVGVLEREP